MATTKKNADSVKKRAPAATRIRRKKVAAPEEAPAEYKVTVHTEERISAAEPEDLVVPNLGVPLPLLVPDASFFTPQTMSFDLKQSKHPKKPHTLARAFLYLVTFIVVVAAATAVILAFRSSRNFVAGTLPVPTAVQPIPTTAAAPVAATTYQLAAFNLPQPVSSAMYAAIAKDLPNVTVDNSAASFIPEDAISSLTVDTLLLKSSAQQESGAVLAELAKLGLQPKLLVNDKISDDFALYLTTVPASTNLSAYTATVVNASGVAGAAKKFCGYLTAYHVASCTAQNGTGKLAGGVQVRYKDTKAMVALARTPEFKSASFAQVDPTAQVEDVQVVIGK